MNYNWKEHNLEKTLFLSNYCSVCQQRKFCRSWSKNVCCPCFLERERKVEKYWEQEERESCVSYRNQQSNGSLLNKKWQGDHYLFHGQFYPFKEFRELIKKEHDKQRQWWQEIAKKCRCQTSKKVRVSGDYWTNCQKCEREVVVASKKRVIKNRNDPRFWGLEMEEKVLCLECLGKYQEQMTVGKRYVFRKYWGRYGKE